MYKVNNTDKVYFLIKKMYFVLSNVQRKNKTQQQPQEENNRLKFLFARSHKGQR